VNKTEKKVVLSVFVVTVLLTATFGAGQAIEDGGKIYHWLNVIAGSLFCGFIIGGITLGAVIDIMTKPRQNEERREAYNKEKENENN
jgi:formate-dependent nitrite reductase membrane component NrfD